MVSSNPEPHDLHDFMRQITNEMSDEYHRIQRRVSEDPGTAGDQGEENWAELLREWLPPTYTVVTKGRIFGHDGQASPQVDVIVLKDIYPQKLVNKKHYLAAGVAAAFECKTTLRTTHISEAIETSAKIKSLYPPRKGTPYKELHAPIIYGLLSHSHSWRAEGSTPEENVRRALNLNDISQINHPSRSLDLICVADLGTWTLSKLTFLGPQQFDYTRDAVLLAMYGPNGSAMSIYVQHSLTQDTQEEFFTPIGSFISHLCRKLAWENASLRDLALYYTKANMGGAGHGGGRRWDSSIYSEEIRARIEAGNLSNGKRWDEWGVFF